MMISELAQRTGLSASRIRFYEASGLLKDIERRPNGYRNYSEQTVRTLTVIKLAQDVGFRLEEIEALLSVRGWPGTYAALLGALKVRYAEIGRMQLRLIQNKAQIEALMAAIENKPDLPCDGSIGQLLADLVGEPVEAFAPAD